MAVEWRLPDATSVVSGPTAPVATPAELAAYVGAPAIAEPQSALLAEMVQAAEERVVGLTGLTGRFFRQATLRAAFDASVYDGRLFRLPGGVVVLGSLVVRMLGADGQPAGTAPVVGAVRLCAGRQMVALSFTPGAGLVMEAVYRVGGQDVPAAVKQAVLRVGAWMYAERTPSMKAMSLDWKALAALVQPWRRL